MARVAKRVGVVLFQLGGPDSLAAVEPFLYNLFCDPDIIDFPFSRIGRRPLAKLISSTRAKKAAKHYAAIGGHSPIRELTERQAQALEARLKYEGIDAQCVVAMRYWHPLTSEAAARLLSADVDEIVLLPLYPQYSRTTTGSSLNEWNRRWPRVTPSVCIEPFYRHPLYIDALVSRINRALAQFPNADDVQLIFSAHGLPISVIEAGDPYQEQIEQTVALVMKHGAWPNSHSLCYQSKVGASRWLQPSLMATLRKIAAENWREVCVIPISFVSDHVETLGEIDHCAREEAGQLGIEHFAMTEGLNDCAKFVDCLTNLVLTAIGTASGDIYRAESGREAVALAMAAD